ncbi:hypothetical protein A2U01_0052718, partial [Trifolium medium]|nr:hypothetical protein [Trifolium medium]
MHNPNRQGAELPGQ